MKGPEQRVCMYVRDLGLWIIFRIIRTTGFCPLGFLNEYEWEQHLVLFSPLSSLTL